ncbi:uncharacterized protein APUU_21510S [Aspergillus puulaauensis]|uniref:Uncharacterized protein n=1 Tax=Aspergillus puulaauensis TaxID=1220207 RepID=A0A7R7XHJ0_9EURO|nr:uncharacterized protein APUU_21510S [Aspergillus puulaauensis]BCS21078.1 hypothetical protein APUU_21510S [Aspergillus puulaauensis]
MAVRMLWLWASLLAISALAEECNRDFEIEYADNTKSLFNNCTTIVGNIDLGEGFKGPITMGDVVNITGTITLRAPSTDDPMGRSSVHRLEAPALEYLGGLVIPDTELGDVSLPKLKNVTGEISISPSNSAGSEVELRFAALEEAGGIDIGLDYMIYDDGSYPLPRLGVDMPSLRSAEYIRLWGYVNSINMPELTTVGQPVDTRHTDRSGLEIQLAEKGDILDISLPKLESVESNLTLSGNIRQPQLDSLTKTSANITIDTSSRLALSLPLIEAKTITLNGTIYSASFSDIQRFESVTVTSQLDDFDCDQFKERLNQASSPGSISCTAGPPSKSLSSGAKIALGVTIPIVMVLVATAMALVLRRRRSVKDKETIAASGTEGPPPYNIAMRPLPPRAEAAAPPPYSAS